jgi:hypothetical protein
MNTQNQQFVLKIDPNYFFNPKSYDPGFVEQYEKLNFTEQKFYQDRITSINSHLLEYGKIWSSLKFKTKTLSEKRKAFYKSCLEVILIDMTFIYDHYIKNYFDILNPAILDLLSLHLEKNFESEANILNEQLDFDFDDFFKLRLTSNLEIFTILFGNDENSKKD